ncbi:MAG: hypothetical protein ACPGRX_00800 [Bdellovibrionales bacterium]
MRQCLFFFFVTALMLGGLFPAPTNAQTYVTKQKREAQQYKAQQYKSQPNAQPQTQTSPQTKAASQTALDYARLAAKSCVPGAWEGQPCLAAISQNTLVMAANYQEALQNAQKLSDSEAIKQHCAAATAAANGEYPAYAMRSAYVECANTVYDVTERSGVRPDLSQYQLLIGAVQCLDKSTACSAFETGLAAYK